MCSGEKILQFFHMCRRGFRHQFFCAGLVKGNADGTINPLGNTTRAELAALISRIAAY